MSRAPFMPLYCDAYLGDTMHLSLEEHGAYLKLLMIIWRNNGQPIEDNPARLARMLGVTPERWVKKLRPVLVSFFDLSSGTWRQHRLEKEWERSQNFIASQREKGSKGGTAKSMKNNESGLAGATDGLKPSSSPPSPYPEEGSVGSDEPTAGEPASVVRFPSPRDPKAELYELGKAVLGKNTGGMVTKLLACHAGNIDETRDTLVLASRKADPREYVGAILRGDQMPETDWDAFYDRMGLPASEYGGRKKRTC